MAHNILVASAASKGLHGCMQNVGNHTRQQERSTACAPYAEEAREAQADASFLAHSPDRRLVHLGTERRGAARAGSSFLSFIPCRHAVRLRAG